MDHRLRVDNKSNTLSNLFHEGKQLPNFDYHRHHDDENNNSPSLHGNGSPLMSKPASPLPPYSPESLWSRSPVSPTYPSHPSLLHCCISSLHRDDGYIYSIAVSGDLVFTGSRSRRVHAWQSLDCHAKGHIHASSGEVRAMVAHGELLFTSHKDHKIRIWSMRSRNGSSTTFKPKKVTTLPSSVSHFKNFISRPITPQHKITSKPIGSLHKDIISCMAHYNVEGLLYTGSFDKTVKAWRVNEKTCVDSFIAHQGGVNDMVINQQNGHLFTCSSDGTVKMWLRVYGENFHALIKVLTFHTYPVHALALSVSASQETFLYSGSSNGSISFWHQELSCRYTHSGNLLQGHRFAVLCLATIEDLVISGSEDSTIKIWRRDLGGGNHNCLAVLEGHGGPVRCLAAHLQQDKFALSFLVYSASLDQAFKVWRVRVLPIDDMKKSPIKDDDNENHRIHNQGFETSHVLSPSWVKKKLVQSRSLHNLI